MNRLLSMLMGFLLVLTFSGSAGAISYSYVDTFEPGSEYMKNYWCCGQKNSYIPWQFDIASLGFDTNTQNIGSATVELNLEDDNGHNYFFDLAGFSFDGSEWAWFKAGQDSWFGEVDTGDYNFGLSAASLGMLSSKGVLNAELFAFWGDFNFKGATLYASETSPAPVPEPATMLLFGGGLVCLAGIARRRRNGKKRGGLSNAETEKEFSDIHVYNGTCSART